MRTKEITRRNLLAKDRRGRKAVNNGNSGCAADAVEQPFVIVRKPRHLEILALMPSEER
jgi:hypothetical protein